MKKEEKTKIKLHPTTKTTLLRHPPKQVIFDDIDR
jgi:hypothetical protein